MSMTAHDEHENGLFPIRTVSSLTGVNSVTLRAWERRYGLLQPVRTAKGHRLYSQADIDRINRVLELLDKGVSISQMKAHLESRQQPGASTGPWGDYQQRMINAVVRFDDQGLEGAYNDALSLYPIEMVTRELILPLLRQLGERWATTEGSVAEEHFFGAYMRNKLGARFHHEASRARGPKLIAACLPGEHHEVGLLLASLTVMAHGYRVVLLGADMPLAELPVVAQRCSAAAVLLSGAIDPAPAVLEQQLPDLVGRLTIPVFVGGPAALRHNDAIVQAGAIPLGSEMQQALARIGTTISATPSQ